jgi:hypothetical protein
MNSEGLPAAKARDAKPNHIPLLAVRLRALVLALGETVRPAWWKTEFMNETGLRFLERLYPRTFVQAAIHAAGKAACDVHDKAVGRVGIYHLFRLPEALESDMNLIPPNADADFIVSFRAALGHQDRLLDLLDSLSNGEVVKDVATGAKRIGTDKELMNVEGFAIIAGVYRNAFAQGKPSFPYFAAQQSIGGGSP